MRLVSHTVLTPQVPVMLIVVKVTLVPSVTGVVRATSTFNTPKAVSALCATFAFSATFTLSATFAFRVTFSFSAAGVRRGASSASVGQVSLARSVFGIVSRRADAVDLVNFLEILRAGVAKSGNKTGTKIRYLPRKAWMFL